MRILLLTLVALSSAVAALPGAARADVSIDLGAATLTLGDRGEVHLAFPDGAAWPATGRSAFAIRQQDRWLSPTAVERRGEELTVTFDGGHSARFDLITGRGFAVLRMTEPPPGLEPDELRLFELGVPEGATLAPTLNAARADGKVAALMAAEPAVQAGEGRIDAIRGDRAGCRHEFAPSDDAPVGRRSARFTATSDDRPGGWSVRGRILDKPLDLSGCVAIRAHVRGDGQGQHLKIQLHDGEGGYRDDYLPIDFVGWKQVTLAAPALNTLRYDRVRHLNLYYNSLPPGRTVTCLIDHVEAILRDADGRERAVLLEDFESADSPFWSAPGRRLTVRTSKRHGIAPAAFGVIACPDAELWDVMPRFQAAAGLPSPRPGGAWAKRSPWVKRSYLFLTDFREAQFDEALALARRGGFAMILLGQESWCRSTGHYEVPRDRFPEGLDGLKRTFGRFREAGFRVGLHFLAASIDANDPYLTPVPDKRLVTGATATLAADIDARADFLPLVAAPTGFPAEDGGYMGDGTIVRIGDELIAYGRPSAAQPHGLAACRRGHLGTKASPHRKGERVAHLVRAYGYHLHDLDSTLLDEVTANFARVANACAVDMLYFDGAEKLQGDHGYYNPRLIRAFYDRLENRDVLLQASSFTHSSWHLLARSASADGHGDLKGYLDERSPAFASFARDGMPLDIGWYYGYDPSATPDMFEYVLGSTIGYDASMSFQVSVAAAKRHPFTGEILDLIARYERLRLSGRVPEAMRARLRIDLALGGQKKPDERARLSALHRREYRLVGSEGREAFQRVIYDPWRPVAEPADRTWEIEVKDGPARVGFQVHVQPGPAPATAPAASATLTDPWLEVAGQRLAWKGTLEPGQYLTVWPGEPIARHVAGLAAPQRAAEDAPTITLPAGKHAVRFGHAGERPASLRVRITLQPPERHAVPPAP